MGIYRAVERPYTSRTLAIINQLEPKLLSMDSHFTSTDYHVRYSTQDSVRSIQ